MEYKNIRDCWAVLESLDEMEDIDKTIEEFPRWSGEWEWTVENGDVVVTNYYVENDNNETDTRVLEQLAPTIKILFDELEITSAKYKRLVKNGEIMELVDNYLSDYYECNVSWHIYSDDSESLTVWIDSFE